MNADLQWRRAELQSAYAKAKKSFPELDGVSISQNIRNYGLISTILNPSLMNTMPEFCSILNSKNKDERKYIINVNRGIFQDKILSDISYDSLVFWSAHEHVHVVQMQNMSVKEISLMFMNYMLNSDYKRNLERETNLETIRRGFGKEFLQAGIDIFNSKNVPESYKEKVRKYYVPEWNQIEHYAKLQNIDKAVYDSLIK